MEDSKIASDADSTFFQKTPETTGQMQPLFEA